MREWLAVVARAWSRMPVLQDTVLASALLSICVVVNSPNSLVSQLAGGAFDGAAGRELALWWAAAALAVVGVALRRRSPLPMLAIGAVSIATHMAQAVPLMIIDIASVLVLLYTVAIRHGRVISLLALAGLLLLVTGWSLYPAESQLPPPRLLPTLIPTAGPVAPIDDSGPAARPEVAIDQDAWSGLLGIGSILAASWAIGSSVRSRRAYLDELHARAHDLERERDQQAALAVAAERGRISRELHDVVAHGLSVMVTQAQGAAAALDNRPAATRTALAAIIKTGRDSLADMRRVLSRVDGVDDAWHPQPGLDRLPTLVAQVRKAGTPVRLHVEGTPAGISPTVDLSAYRIVQEALTNAMKHAGAGAEAEVVIAYQGTEVAIEVSDNGGGVNNHHDGRGNGLRGMHERVRLLGGHLTAGPGPVAGFLVRAALPLQGPDA